MHVHHLRYVCMYHTYVCMYVYTYIRIYVSMYTYILVYYTYTFGLFFQIGLRPPLLLSSLQPPFDLRPSLPPPRNRSLDFASLSVSPGAGREPP